MLNKLFIWKGKKKVLKIVADWSLNSFFGEAFSRGKCMEIQLSSLFPKGWTNIHFCKTENVFFSYLKSQIAQQKLGWSKSKKIKVDFFDPKNKS